MKFRDLTLVSLGAAALSGLCSVPASAQQSVDYSDADNWLCRPDNPRACLVDLDSTIVHADGRLALAAYTRQSDPVVDCFYVYPTVSQDSTANSDMEAGPEEMSVIRSQFARMGSACRQFAPLYRQVTLTALRAGMTGDDSMNPDRQLGYEDVVNAWEYYLEHHNDGRGVVLVGHSQGSGVLARLIANEIEGTPAQNRILSAMLIGTTVRVPPGESVGGTFREMPLCQSADELGCIITYASFRATNPPPAGSLFARNNEDNTAACTNPAQLAHGHDNLHAYMSNQAAEGFASTGPSSPWTGEGVSIGTPFVSVPGLLSAECVNEEGFNYLRVTVNADPEDPRADEISGDVMNADGSINEAWGLHLIDVNIAMGDLLSIIRAQTAAWLSTPR